MSDCPATSLVRLDSAKVVELAGATVARIDAERARRRAEIEAKVSAYVAHRAASRWRWFLGVPTPREAADWLNVDWGLRLVDFYAGKSRETAVRLLRAANLAPEVWVSISDLAAVS
jgi:hypothetical protein